MIYFFGGIGLLITIQMLYCLALVRAGYKFPKTERKGLPVPGCRQGPSASEGPGSGVYKPLMRKPRAPDEGRADRDTAGNIFRRIRLSDPRRAVGRILGENQGTHCGGLTHPEKRVKGSPSGHAASVLDITPGSPRFHEIRRSILRKILAGGSDHPGMLATPGLEDRAKNTQDASHSFLAPSLTTRASMPSRVSATPELGTLLAIHKTVKRL